MRAQAISYHDQLKAVPGDAQARGEYVSGFSVRVREDKHSLHLGDDDSDEERGVRPLRRSAVTLVMTLLFFFSLTRPFYLSVLSLLVFPSLPPFLKN